MKYAYLVMTNMDPMSRNYWWEPDRVFMSRKEANEYIKREWRSQWTGYATSDIPIEKDDVFSITKVRLG